MRFSRYTDGIHIDVRKCRRILHAYTVVSLSSRIDQTNGATALFDIVCRIRNWKQEVSATRRRTHQPTNSADSCITNKCDIYISQIRIRRLHVELATDCTKSVADDEAQLDKAPNKSTGLMLTGREGDQKLGLDDNHPPYSARSPRSTANNYRAK